MNYRLCAATAIAVIFCLAVPAASSAATRDVYMGTPPSIGKQMEKLLTDANAYFPANTKIHVGDTVRFLPVGFHNANFPKTGGKPNPLFVPGKPAAGENDAAGAAFWFNGQPTFGFNPAIGPPGLFGRSTTYNGSKAVETGLPLSNKPKPAKVRFTKTGSFTYYCSVHAGMKAKVNVVGRRSSAPSAKAHAAAIAKQTKAAVATAKELEKRKAPSVGVTVGVAGSGGIERFAFSPDKLTVKVGDTVTFTMGSKSYDVHSASTGPGDAMKEPKSYMGQLAAKFEGTEFPGQAIYPSDPPAAGVATLTPTFHGNGFWSSGLMDRSSASPLPTSGSVKFGAPGSYTFICLIHPFMKATVTAAA